MYISLVVFSSTFTITVELKIYFFFLIKLIKFLVKKVIISAALNVHSDDPLLHVYNSTQEKLEVLTEQYNKANQKVCHCYAFFCNYNNNSI